MKIYSGFERVQFSQYVMYVYIFTTVSRMDHPYNYPDKITWRLERFEHILHSHEKSTRCHHRRVDPLADDRCFKDSSRFVLPRIFLTILTDFCWRKREERYNREQSCLQRGQLSDDHRFVNNWSFFSFFQRWPYVSSDRGAGWIAAVELYMHIRLELPFFVLDGITRTLEVKKNKYR